MLNVSQAVELGSRFTVNFEKRTLRLDRELVSLDDVNILPLNGSVMLREIERYYQQYKHSIPSERSESHRRCYFKALPEKDLSDHDMLYGVSREVARCQLEVFVLLMLFDGQLQWQSKWGQLVLAVPERQGPHHPPTMGRAKVKRRLRTPQKTGRGIPSPTNQPTLLTILNL